MALTTESEERGFPHQTNCRMQRLILWLYWLLTAPASGLLHLLLLLPGMLFSQILKCPLPPFSGLCSTVVSVIAFLF